MSGNLCRRPFWFRSQKPSRDTTKLVCHFLSAQAKLKTSLNLLVLISLSGKLENFASHKRYTVIVVTAISENCSKVKVVTNGQYQAACGHDFSGLAAWSARRSSNSSKSPPSNNNWRQRSLQSLPERPWQPRLRSAAWKYRRSAQASSPMRIRSTESNVLLRGPFYTWVLPLLSPRRIFVLQFISRIPGAAQSSRIFRQLL